MLSQAGQAKSGKITPPRPRFRTLGNRVSKPTSSILADKLEQAESALTAADIAKVLAISRITVFKLARAGVIPCFRISTCVRFDPRAVADWIRSGGLR